jgi:hypothetical protein
LGTTGNEELDIAREPGYTKIGVVLRETKAIDAALEYGGCDSRLQRPAAPR